MNFDFILGSIWIYFGSQNACKKQPSFFIKKAAGLPKGASDVGREIVGRVKKSQVREIAEAKMPDLNANDVEAAMKIIEGTARSMGVEVVEG